MLNLTVMFTQGHMNCTMFDFTEALKEEERYKIYDEFLADTQNVLLS